MRGRWTFCFLGVMIVVFSLVVGHGQINPTQPFLTQCLDRITNRQRCIEQLPIRRACCVNGRQEMCDVISHYQYRQPPLPLSVYYKRLESGCSSGSTYPCTPAQPLTCPMP